MAYLVFLVSVLYAIAFLLLLLSAFAIQHSLMARPAFKRWWTRIVPTRSSAAPTCYWSAGWTPARAMLWAVYLAGWVWWSPRRS